MATARATKAPTKRKPRKPKTAAPAKIGRPSLYTEELADTICEAIATTACGLDTICEDHKGFPHPATIVRWITDNEEFRGKYTRAKERQADRFVEEIVEIADDGRNDWMERRRENGETIEVVNAEHISRSKLRIETRKWLAGKLAPKKYGEKATLEHTGAEGKPLTVRLLGPND